MAALAFVYLWENAVRPLDYMDLQAGDHARVVIGNTHTGEWPEHSADWGRDAVWCDPWLKKSFVIKDFIDGKVGIIPPPRYPRLQTWDGVLQMRPRSRYRVAFGLERAIPARGAETISAVRVFGSGSTGVTREDKVAILDSLVTGEAARHRRVVSGFAVLTK
jgi:hypothetical protein